MNIEAEIASQLALNESLWRRWREEGVNETTPLDVDFDFYATNKVLAEKLAGALRQAGLQKVELRSTRTLWFFKGWVVAGVETGTWSLQRLQDRTLKYCKLAAVYRARMEGCGAVMPDNKNDLRGAASDNQSADGPISSRTDPQ